jgi:hypothetical protein
MRTTLVVANVAWLAGLVRSSGSDGSGNSRGGSRPRRIARELEPLDEGHSRKLLRSERAQLELGLVAYWRGGSATGETRGDDPAPA